MNRRQSSQHKAESGLTPDRRSDEFEFELRLGGRRALFIIFRLPKMYNSAQSLELRILTSRVAMLYTYSHPQLSLTTCLRNQL